jgi:hypothetical protein
VIALKRLARGAVRINRQDRRESSLLKACIKTTRPAKEADHWQSRRAAGHDCFGPGDCWSIFYLNP